MFKRPRVVESATLGVALEAGLGVHRVKNITSGCHSLTLPPREPAQSTAPASAGAQKIVAGVPHALTYSRQAGRLCSDALMPRRGRDSGTGQGWLAFAIRAVLLPLKARERNASTKEMGMNNGGYVSMIWGWRGGRECRLGMEQTWGSGSTHDRPVLRLCPHGSSAAAHPRQSSFISNAIFAVFGRLC